MLLVLNAGSTIDIGDTLNNLKALQDKMHIRAAKTTLIMIMNS